MSLRAVRGSEEPSGSRRGGSPSPTDEAIPADEPEEIASVASLPRNDTDVFMTNQLPENIRPWGRYDILECADTHQVKRISVNPGARLSYQRHQRREEFWVIISGRARFTLDDVDTEHGAGEVLRVHFRAKHRVQNIGGTPLVFIEVQRGDYFGEDDIERFSDDYGREGTTAAHGAKLLDQG